MNEDAENRESEAEGANPLKVMLHAGDLLLKVAVIAVFLFALFYGGRTLYNFG